MNEMIQPASGSSKASGNLYHVIELILDRGLVIDVFVRVSLVGIEVLTIDARVVVASVDAYLRFVAACNRLELTEGSQPLGLPEAVGQVDRRPARSEVRVSSA